MTNADEFFGAFSKLMYQGIAAGTKRRLEPVYALIGYELYDEVTNYMRTTPLKVDSVCTHEAPKVYDVPIYRDYRIKSGIKFIYDESDTSN